MTMSRILAACLAVSLSCAALAGVPQPPAVTARAWLLMDATSGQPIAGGNPEERIEPASLTKLMTAYVVFGALKGRSLAPGQAVPVSERAWRAAGSRMFIEPRKPVTVQELLRGMIVQSGNDACIALAEAVAGSEPAFVARMNREARRLGMKSTNFTNSTGLPDPGHYSTASDLALLAAALIRDYPEHYKLYSEREYRYNDITQQNRTGLLWLDPTVTASRPAIRRAPATASSPRRSAAREGWCRWSSARLRSACAPGRARSCSISDSSRTTACVFTRRARRSASSRCGKAASASWPPASP